MAPGSSPFWGAGGLEGAKSDCMGFLCLPRRPCHWRIHKHGVHTFTNDQLGLAERDEGTHHMVFTHLRATNLPGGIGAVLRSDAAQTRRLHKAASKIDRKRQRRLEQAAANSGVATVVLLVTCETARRLSVGARPLQPLHALLLCSRRLHPNGATHWTRLCFADGVLAI